MSDKIKEFPLIKKATPEDFFVPVYHECIEGHMSWKWMLQIHGGEVRVICTDCSEWCNMSDLISKVLEEYSE